MSDVTEARVRPALTIPITAMLLLVSTGCSYSSEYVPKPSPKVRLRVLEDGFHFHQSGEDWPVARGLEKHLACEPRAASTMEAAIADFRTSAILSFIADATLLLGVGAVAVIPLSVVSHNKNHSGMAKVVDAMNMHNDARMCVASTGGDDAGDE